MLYLPPQPPPACYSLPERAAVRPSVVDLLLLSTVRLLTVARSVAFLSSLNLNPEPHVHSPLAWMYDRVPLVNVSFGLEGVGHFPWVPEFP